MPGAARRTERPVAAVPAAAPRHLLHVFSTFAVGGPQVRFATLTAAHGDRYRHTLIALDRRCEARELLDPAVHIEIREAPVTKGSTLANVLRIRRFLGTLRPDLLVTYNWGAIEWGLANMFSPMLPHLHVEDGFGPEEAQRQLPRRVLLRRIGLRNARRLIVPAETIRRIATDVWRINPARIAYIPNGIDCRHFAAPPPGPVPPGMEGLADNRVVATVAALRPEKNLPRLVRVFAAVQRKMGDVGLVIAGDGPAREAIVAEADRLGIADRVRLIGHVSDPHAVLARSDLFVLSSDTEQMPISIIEAMAAGLAVAATDVGDVRSMLSEANSRYVVAPTDEAGLASAVRTLLEDDALRRSIGEANRTQAAGRFDASEMFRAYDEVFSGAAAGK